jgi:hypothetical protein
VAGHPIDSLFIEIGLDASKFDKQQQEALSRFKQTQEAARKGARDVEDSGRSVVDTLEGIKTQALEMFAVVSGGKSLIDFSLNITHAGAALGRLERNIGVSAQTIGKWQALARIFGGDAQTMAQSFVSISDAFAGWKVGAVSPLIADLRAISTAGGKIIDVNKGVEQSFLDLAENLKNIHDKDPALAGFLGRKIGLDPALFDAMIQGPAGIQKVLEYVQKLGVATKEDTDAFGELEKRIGQMGVKAESLGRKVLGVEGGVAAKIMEVADILNMSPGDAWKYLNDPNRKPLGQNFDAKSGPGSKLFPGAGAALPSGAFGSQAEKEAFIRAEAVKRGIDPDVAMRVARAEGFNSFVSAIPGEQSYGAFQLHVTPGGRGGAVGDQFRSQTGLDPSDPSNERAGIAFALDDIRRNGWGAYHGAARAGVTQWAGVAAAQGGGAGSTIHDDHSIHVDRVEINAGAGADGAKIARDFRTELIQRQSRVSQADYGQN